MILGIVGYWVYHGLPHYSEKKLRSGVFLQWLGLEISFYFLDTSGLQAPKAAKLAGKADVDVLRICTWFIGVNGTYFSFPKQFGKCLPRRPKDIRTSFSCGKTQIPP
jgi:hypothetical protein